MFGLDLQVVRADDRDRDGILRLVLGRGQVDGNVSLLEGRDLIMIGLLGIGLVARAVNQMQVEAVFAFADHDAFFGQGHAWIGGIGDVGQEDALPHGGPLRAVHVLHVEDGLGEAFVENSRTDFEGDLRAFEAIFEMCQRGLRTWGEVESVEQREQPGADDEDGEDAQESPDAEAAGAHGGDFTVGREAAEADQDADQHAHWNGVGERERHGEKENLCNAG